MSSALVLSPVLLQVISQLSEGNIAVYVVGELFFPVLIYLWAHFGSIPVNEYLWSCLAFIMLYIASGTPVPATDGQVATLIFYLFPYLSGLVIMHFLPFFAVTEHLSSAFDWALLKA